MAHPVISDPEVLAKIEENRAKKEPKVVERITTVFKTKLPSVVDSLVLLTISFWYFFFTGLAILFRAPIPKEWLRIATSLSRGRMAKKIADLGVARDDSVKVQKNTHRIIDLETQKPITPIP